MKISSTILALALSQAAHAFVTQPNKAANRHSSIFSTPPFPESGSPEFGAGYDPASSMDVGGTTSGAMQTAGKASKGPGADKVEAVTVQGGSLRTWSFSTPLIERVQVKLSTNGRPLNADVDLWQGPDNTPQKMAVYVEDGSLRPFNAIVETPRGQNTISVLNTASMEYPLEAEVVAGTSGPNVAEMASSEGVTVQGGAIKTYSFGAQVGSVQVVLKTDGRPLNARIELLQGPNNNKQVIDLYTEDGLDRPFYAVIETPGSGNVIRVVNTATMEYPLTCAIDPFSVEPGFEGDVSDGNWNKKNDATFFFLNGQ